MRTMAIGGGIARERLASAEPSRVVTGTATPRIGVAPNNNVPVRGTIGIQTDAVTDNRKIEGIVRRDYTYVQYMDRFGRWPFRIPTVWWEYAYAQEQRFFKFLARRYPKFARFVFAQIGRSSPNKRGANDRDQLSSRVR